MTRAAAIGAVVVAALLARGPARGRGVRGRDAKRARHFQAGEARFKAGAFDEALAEYQAGYDAKPLPGFLVNIAQCQRRLGDLKKARATYQKFVLVAPDSPLVPQVRSMIAEIDGLLAEASRRSPRAEPDAEAKPAAAAPAPPRPAPARARAASPRRPTPRPRRLARAAAPPLVAVGRARRGRRWRRGHGGRTLDGRHDDNP